MLDSIVNPNIDPNVGSLFSCPGDCTFTEYGSDPLQRDDTNITHATVGMCSRCVDVHGLVKGPDQLDQGMAPGQGCSFELPIREQYDDPGARVNIKLSTSWANSQYMSIRDTGDLSWAREAVPQGFINQARWSLSHFSVLAVSQNPCGQLPDGNFSCPNSCNETATSNDRCPFDPQAWSEGTDYVAATCIVYPCIKHFAGRVKSHVFSENLVRDIPLRQQGAHWSADLSYRPGIVWKEVQQPCLVGNTLYTSSNMSSSAGNLGPNATVTLEVHDEDWASQDENTPAKYINMTAPRECVFEMSHELAFALRDVMLSSFNANCMPDQHRVGSTICNVPDRSRKKHTHGI